MIIQEKDIGHILSEWKKRLSSDDYSEESRCALGECLYDIQGLVENAQDSQEFLQDVISQLPSEEVEDYMRGLEADEELSMMEAHETVA